VTQACRPRAIASGYIASTEEIGGRRLVLVLSRHGEADSLSSAATTRHPSEALDGRFNSRLPGNIATSGVSLSMEEIHAVYQEVEARVEPCLVCGEYVDFGVRRRRSCSTSTQLGCSRVERLRRRRYSMGTKEHRALTERAAASCLRQWTVAPRTARAAALRSEAGKRDRATSRGIGGVMRSGSCAVEQSRR